MHVALDDDGNYEDEIYNALDDDGWIIWWDDDDDDDGSFSK